MGTETDMDAGRRVRDYLERLLNQRDLNVCALFLAPDYIDHDAPEDTPPGPAATREYVAGLLEAYPDLRLDVEDVVSQDRKAALRLRWSGTHGQTGEALDKSGLIVVHLDEQGRLTERWSAYT